jgi:hypothetical protein
MPAGKSDRVALVSLHRSRFAAPPEIKVKKIPAEIQRKNILNI